MTNTLNNQIYDGIEASQFDDDYDSFQTRNLSSSLSKYAPLFCLQIATSLLSVFATIVVVRISVPKLDSTYQRYIFMLNISSMVNSIFLALHPLLTPKNMDLGDTNSGGYWSIGNSATCTTVGFFLVFGSIMVSMYHTAIALYFYFSVETIQGNYNSRSKKEDKKKNGTNNERRLTTTSKSESLPSSSASADESVESSTAGTIGSKAEIMANILCLFFPAVLAGTAATLNSFGFNPNVDLCTLYGSYDINGDTTWMVMRNLFRWSLVTSGAITLLITIVVRFRVGFFQKKEYDDDICAATSDINKNSNASGSSLGAPDGVEDGFERQIIGQKLNAISAQCLFYTVSYISSYVWFVALAFISTNNDSRNDGLLYAFQTMTVIFYPLLGVFNCAIYVRPRVQMLSIMYPEDSYISVLRVAMSKAGDPEEIEEVRATIYGSDYYEPEEDDPEASERSGGFRGGDNGPSPDLQIPYVVQFDQSTAIKGESLTNDDVEEDDNDSVSQISDS